MSESFLTKMLITRPLELMATEGPMVNRQQSIEPLKKLKKMASKKKCIFKWNALYVNYPTYFRNSREGIAVLKT